LADFDGRHIAKGAEVLEGYQPLLAVYTALAKLWRFAPAVFRVAEA